MDEIVPELANLGPRDCAAARRLVPIGQPIPALLAGEADGHTPGMMNAMKTDRQARLASDIRSQRDEIIAHRNQMIRRLGRIVSLDEAARDWIPRHAQAWRSENEATSGESVSSP